MVVNLKELVPDLPDVRGNNHQVPIGEADQYVPIPVPSRDTQEEKGPEDRYLAAMIRCWRLVKRVIVCGTSDRT